MSSSSKAVIIGAAITSIGAIIAALLGILEILEPMPLASMFEAN